MDYDYEIYLLSQKFLDNYPSDQYPELLSKQGRPYSCILINVTNYFICVPFRSNIQHDNAFMFKGTRRALNNKSGLDYSKIVIIKDTSYLDNKNAIVDKDEYNETVAHMSKIANDAKKYVDTYIAHVKGTKVLHPRDFDRKYKYSTLKYFENELLYL